MIKEHHFQNVRKLPPLADGLGLPGFTRQEAASQSHSYQLTPLFNLGKSRICSHHFQRPFLLFTSQSLTLLSSHFSFPSQSRFQQHTIQSLHTNHLFNNTTPLVTVLWTTATYPRTFVRLTSNRNQPSSTART